MAMELGISGDCLVGSTYRIRYGVNPESNWKTFLTDMFLKFNGTKDRKKRRKERKGGEREEEDKE